MSYTRPLGVNDVSGLYGPGTYLAWLLSITSLILRKHLKFDDDFGYTEVLPIAGYSLIAIGDAWIRQVHLKHYGNAYFDESLVAATYVSQASFGTSLILNMCSTKTVAEDTDEVHETEPITLFSPPNLLSLIYLCLFSYIFIGSRDDLELSISRMVAICLLMVVHISALKAVLLFPSRRSLGRWRGLNASWASVALFSHTIPFFLLVYDPAPLSIITIYVWNSACLTIFPLTIFPGASIPFIDTVVLLLWSLVMLPFLAFEEPLTMVPRTGSNFTDLDQAVAFCGAVVVLLYQWRVKLKQWWGELRDLYQRRVRPFLNARSR